MTAGSPLYCTQAKRKDLVVTEIEPVANYYTAEPYHQQ